MGNLFGHKKWYKVDKIRLFVKSGGGKRNKNLNCILNIECVIQNKRVQFFILIIL